MPQIQQLALAYGSQFFWLGLVLAIIYFGVGHYMVPKIESTVDGRNAKIAADLGAAQAAQAAAEQQEEAWRARMSDAHTKAQGVIAKAKTTAGTQSAAAIAKADAGISDETEAANMALEKSRADAVNHVRDMAADLARDIVAKVAGLNVAAAKAQAAVKEAGHG